MKKIIYISIIVWVVGIYNLRAQQVVIHFPLMAGKEAKLFYFAATQVDSLLTTIDVSGKAVFHLSGNDYSGMAALVVSGAGGIEMVVSEPSVLAKCHSSTVDMETVKFPHSEENRFLSHIFITQSRYMQQTAWLQAGKDILDIIALYTSGTLWESVCNFYISLFNHTAGEDKQQEYAASVLRTLDRLSAPYYEAFLASTVTETERFGWYQARDSILSMLNPSFTSSIGSLQRATGAYRANNGQIMSPLVGLNESKEPYGKTLIAFYDSDCSSCVNEMFRLISIYPKLREEGIRVVSIAADTNKERYEEEIKNFPWEDKLCDFKGFEGENFSNYNVIASPSFFLIDSKRRLSGTFYSVKDVEEAVKH
ncbi:MAG: thioredoxin family protein [Bacteroidales bacterium]|nr:thioredoxin family protein [Bacteroidales bacterium]